MMSVNSRKRCRKDKLVPRSICNEHEDEIIESSSSLKVEDILITNIISNSTEYSNMQMLRGDPEYDVVVREVTPKEIKREVTSPPIELPTDVDHPHTQVKYRSPSPIDTKLIQLLQGHQTSAPVKFSIKVEVEECDGDDDRLVIDESDNITTGNPIEIDDKFDNIVNLNKPPEKIALEEEVTRKISEYPGTDKGNIKLPKKKCPPKIPPKMLVEESLKNIYNLSILKIVHATNEILKISNSVTNRILAIGVRNTLGQVLVKHMPMYMEDTEKQIQNVLEEWIIGKWKSSPLFYKCYACTKAWWHLDEFRVHLKSHTDTLKVCLEEISHEECNIVAYNENEPKKIDILIADPCWKCGKPCHVHQLSLRVVDGFYMCTACSRHFPSCIALRDHDNYCVKQALHMAGKHRCFICMCLFMNEIELEAHYLLSHDVRSDMPATMAFRKCTACNGTYLVFIMHICPVKQKNMKCNYCFRKFTQKTLADLHMNTANSRVQCKVCNLALPKACMELEHILMHDDTTTKNFTFGYACSLCKDVCNEDIITILLDENALGKHCCTMHNTKMDKRRPIFEKILIPLSCLPTDSADGEEDEMETECLPEALEPATLLEEASESPQDSLVPVHEIKIEYEDLPIGGHLDAQPQFSIQVKEEPIETEEYVVEENEMDNADWNNQDIIIKEQIKADPDFYEDDIISYAMTKRPPKRPRNKPAKIYYCKCGFESVHWQMKEHLKDGCVQGTFRRSSAVSEPEVYGCTKCDKSYDSLKSYLSHLMDHELPYGTCPKCYQKFDKYYPLMVHVRSHVTKEFLKVKNIYNSAGAKYRCSVCEDDVYNGGLFAHWESHLELYPGPSEEATTSITELPPPSNENALQTDVLAALLSRLQNNSRDMHHKRGLRTCTYCSRVFNRYYECKRHLIEHLLADAFASKSKYQCLRCQICGGGFLKQDHYRKHMRDHASLPIFQCELCNKSFSDSSNFTKHKKVHNLQVLICDICKSKFQAKSSLIKHLEMHAGTGAITCSICLKVFYTQSHYKKHKRVTHDVIPDRYACKQCSLRFHSLREKWDHLWQVHQERKFQADCRLCPRQFRNFSRLRVHVRQAHAAPRARPARRPAPRAPALETLVVYE